MVHRWGHWSLLREHYVAQMVPQYGYRDVPTVWYRSWADFPIHICDLNTDAIIGTDTLESVLPHTLDIKNGLLFTEGGVSLQLHRNDTALS